MYCAYLFFFSILPFFIQGQNSNGDLRLIGSPAGSGRLEIYLSNQSRWGTVCDDSFNLFEGDIACRELGFLYADRVGNVGNLGFPVINDSISPIFLDNVDCNTMLATSSSARLVDCPAIVLDDNCNHVEDVALECSNNVNPVRLSASVARTVNLSSGWFDIFINGEWGTVCDDASNLFSKAAADVACRQLGFLEANAYNRVREVGFTQLAMEFTSSVPIWLSDIACSSSGNNIRQCSHGGTGLTSSCSHTEDIFLSCTGERNLRLVASDNPSSTALLPYGRLEVYLNGEWGTVCDDFFSPNDANVACKQLGYSGYVQYDSARDLGYPETSSGPIWLDNLACTGSELTLTDCNRLIGGSCDHSEDVGLRCSLLGAPGTAAPTPTRTTTSVTSPPAGSSVGGSVAGGIITTLFLVGCVGAFVFCIFFGRKRRLNRPHIRNLVVVPPSHTTVVAITINKNNATPTTALQGRSNQTTGAYPQKNSLYPQLPSAYPA